MALVLAMLWIACADDASADGGEDLSFEGVHAVAFSPHVRCRAILAPSAHNLYVWLQCCLPRWEEGKVLSGEAESHLEEDDDGGSDHEGIPVDVTRDGNGSEEAHHEEAGGESESNLPGDGKTSPDDGRLRSSGGIEEELQTLEATCLGAIVSSDGEDDETLAMTSSFDRIRNALRACEEVCAFL